VRKGCLALKAVSMDSTVGKHVIERQEGHRVVGRQNLPPAAWQRTTLHDIKLAPRDDQAPRVVARQNCPVVTSSLLKIKIQAEGRVNAYSMREALGSIPGTAK
jgi:hypothetical protein